MELTKLVDDYFARTDVLRQAVAGMTPEQIRARPIPGKMSTLEVVCHIGDFEIVHANRIKRMIAEENPPLRSGDPDLFAARLVYHDRDLAEELTLIV